MLKICVFGLNCFTRSYFFSKNQVFEPSRAGYSFKASFPFFFFIFSCFHFFIFQFVLFVFFLKNVFQFFPKNLLLLTFVTRFNKICFLRSRCSMEIWCLDDTGRDSWDWVGGEHASAPQSGVGGSSPVKTEPPQIVLLL